MISVSYLFEGKVLDHLKKHKGKYALGAAAAGLYYSDDITPRPVKNLIRRAVTGKDTIESSDQLLKGYENHPYYKDLKSVADSLDKEDLNRLTKFSLESPENMGEGNVAQIKLQPAFSNFRDKEINLRNDLSKELMKKLFKHELTHHVDLGKDTFTKILKDNKYPYDAQVREHVANDFAKNHNFSDKEHYRDVIKKIREKHENLAPYERMNNYKQLNVFRGVDGKLYEKQ
jgi:hypothetical protein